MKKILFIDHVNRILGGAEINLIELLSLNVVHSHWEVACALDPTGPLGKSISSINTSKKTSSDSDHIKIYNYQLPAGLNEMRVVGKHPLAPITRMFSAVQALGTARRILEEIITDFKPDAIITIPNKDHIAASKISQKYQLYHIWWINDILSPEFFPLLARKAFFKASKLGCNQFAAVSDCASSSLIKGGLDRHKVFTVHNGIPIDKYSRHQESDFRNKFNIGNDVFCFGIIGRWCQWKGQEHFIKIAQHWRKERSDFPTQFLIIGKAFNEDKEYEISIREKAKKANEEAGAEIIKFISFQSNLQKVLSSIDCLIHASTQPEPFGRVIIEAMACQTPVIGANAGAVPEIISDGVNGLLATPNSVESYLSQMKTLVDDDTLRRKMTKEALDTVKNKFDVSRVFEDFDRIIEQAT